MLKKVRRDASMNEQTGQLKLTPLGPERLTLLERIIGLTHLPYSIGCLLIAVATGGPGYFLAWYVYSFSLEEAWRRMLSNTLRGVFSIAQFSQEMPVAQALLGTTIGTFTLFLGMYLVRHWRLKVVTAKSKLSSLSPNGETAYNRAFGLVSSAKGALLVAFVFFLLYFPLQSLTENNPVSLFFAFILTPLSVLALGTAFWVYLSGLWGLRRFGLEPLNLKRFYEDKMLGLRPLGQIAVSFASTFFVLIISFFAVTLLSADIYNMAVVLVCILLALAMLFLPLWGIHGKMSQVKQQEEASLRLRSIEPMIASPEYSGTEDPQVLSRIEELLRLQATISLEDKVSNVSVWPFETKVVKQLVAIIVSVATLMLARILQLVFHL